MKLTAFLTLLVILNMLSEGQNLAWMTKFEYKDLNSKVFSNVSFRIRSHSRTIQTLGGRGSLLVNLSNIIVDYKALMKMTSTWRQLVSFAQIEACKLAETSTPYIEEIKKILIQRIPDVPVKCPVMSNTFYWNYTHNDTDNPVIALLKKYVSSTILPNGEYRHVVKISNKKYGTIGSFALQIRRYERLNEETFR